MIAMQSRIRQPFRSLAVALSYRQPQVTAHARVTGGFSGGPSVLSVEIHHQTIQSPGCSGRGRSPQRGLGLRAN